VREHCVMNIHEYGVKRHEYARLLNTRTLHIVTRKIFTALLRR